MLHRPSPGAADAAAFDIHISLRARGDRAAQIYRQLLDAILDGRLGPGIRLPPTRELATRLGVSRNTVAVAYERLTAEGFLDSKVGAGTFVSPAAASQPGDRRRAPRGEILRPRPVWSSIPEPPPVRSAPPPYDFSIGVPDLALFPLDTWRRLVGRELSRAVIRDADYAEPTGHAGLKGAIARYIGISRSVRVDADDVVVTQGAQQALDLVGRVLIDHGATVAVEDPGYPPARQLFASLGARVIGVPVDEEGLVVDQIPATARLVHVTPSHQFPLGTAMSLARRTALLAWAARRNAVIIEDDYDSEFRFADRPLEPLQSLDRAGRVIYVGTYSKSLLPMLRLGFVVAPESLQPALRTAKLLADGQGDVVTQGALARFIEEGQLGRHIRRMTRVYAERHAAVVAAVGGELAEWLEVVPSAAGLHVSTYVRAGSGVDLGRSRRLAARSGVVIRQLGPYYMSADRTKGIAAPETNTEPRDGLVIGYGAINTERIAPGMQLLAAALHPTATV